MKTNESQMNMESTLTSLNEAEHNRAFFKRLINIRRLPPSKRAAFVYRHESSSIAVQSNPATGNLKSEGSDQNNHGEENVSHLQKKIRALQVEFQQQEEWKKRHNQKRASFANGQTPLQNGQVEDNRNISDNTDLVNALLTINQKGSDTNILGLNPLSLRQMQQNAYFTDVQNSELVFDQDAKVSQDTTSKRKSNDNQVDQKKRLRTSDGKTVADGEFASNVKNCILKRSFVAKNPEKDLISYAKAIAPGSTESLFILSENDIIRAVEDITQTMLSSAQASSDKKQDGTNPSLSKDTKIDETYLSNSIEESCQATGENVKIERILAEHKLRMEHLKSEHEKREHELQNEIQNMKVLHARKIENCLLAGTEGLKVVRKKVTEDLLRMNAKWT